MSLKKSFSHKRFAQSDTIMRKAKASPLGRQRKSGMQDFPSYCHVFNDELLKILQGKRGSSKHPYGGFRKVYLRLLSQQVAPGYPDRWTGIEYHPGELSEEKVFDIPKYGQALGLFKGNVSLPSLIAIVSLDNVTITEMEEFKYSIKQNKGSNQELVFQFPTQRFFSDFCTAIGSISNKSDENVTMREFPLQYAPVNDSEDTRVAYEFSEEAKFQENTSIGDSLFELTAGTQSDFMKWGLVQSKQTESDSLIVVSVLLYLHLKGKSISEFIDVIKNLRIKGKQRDEPKYAYLVKLGEQITRNYTLLSIEERKKFIKYSSKRIGVGAVDVLKDQLNKYSMKKDIAKVLSLHKTIHVHPEWNVTNTEELVLRDISSRDIAEQLTLLEALHHKQIEIKELFANSKNLDENSGLKLATKWWNRINFWVSGEILKCTSSKLQLKALKKFLRVAKHLFNIRNYSSCSQVLAGINHNVVQRLRRLRAIIPEAQRNSIESLSARLSHKENYQKYRSLPHISPYLSFLPVVQRDIIFINDGNEEFVDGKLLNVDRCKMLTEAIARSGLLHPQYTFSFPYERNSLIVNYIVENSTYSEDELYAMSEKLEPIRVNSNEDKEEKESTDQVEKFNPLFQSSALKNYIAKRKDSEDPISDSIEEPTKEEEIKEGYLFLRDGNEWNKYWFDNQYPKLTYYTSNTKETDGMGSIDLGGNSEIEKIGKKKNLAITISTDKQAISIKGETDKITLIWFNQLSAQINK